MGNTIEVNVFIEFCNNIFRRNNPFVFQCGWTTDADECQECSGSLNSFLLILSRRVFEGSFRLF